MFHLAADRFARYRAGAVSEDEVKMKTTGIGQKEFGWPW
jgi:hypothetical protein